MICAIVCIVVGTWLVVSAGTPRAARREKATHAAGGTPLALTAASRKDAATPGARVAGAAAKPPASGRNALFRTTQQLRSRRRRGANLCKASRT